MNKEKLDLLNEMLANHILEKIEDYKNSRFIFVDKKMKELHKKIREIQKQGENNV